MTTVEEVLKSFYIDIKSHKALEECSEEEKEKELLDLLNTAKNDEMWQIFFDFQFDETAAKEQFSVLNAEQRKNIFHFGIACFISFIQSNFTGPLSKELETYLFQTKFTTVEFAKLLSVNNEEINVNTQHPCLLVVSKLVFEHCLVANVVNTWWSWRHILIHQQVIDELSPTLLSNADRLYKQVETLSLDGHTKAKFYLEIAQLYILFLHVYKAKDHILEACEILGLNHTLVGKLGKRTKFQEKDIAQLTLEVSLEEKTDIKRPVVDDLDIPQNITLKDDVRLDTMVFIEDSNNSVALPNSEQVLLLLTVQETLIARPRDDLQVEELQPYLDIVLSQKNTWSVRLVALLLRCKFECTSRRTIERALSQCEELIAAIAKETPHVLARVADVFGAGVPPIWKIEAQYADIMLNLGLAKASLDVYLKIKLWEEVIVCYTLLKLRHKAAEVIKEQLEKKPTVKMWCLLGDSTDDASCYEKAWDLSKKRSHRAQRHWGMYLYSHKQYAECIPHFERSVSINPLQATVWIRLGYAALQTENWQTAATAFRRYTTLEPDGYQAWNNLAQAYIKLGNLRSAHFAILEALKFNYENWKIWENLLLVSGDILHFGDLIRAYHNLLDLKEKYLNLEVLNTLVYNVYMDTNDVDGQPSSQYMQKARVLLGRVTSLYPGEGYLWELYGKLAPDALLRAQRLQRAFRAYTQVGWDKDPETCMKVMRLCRELSDLLTCQEIDARDTIINNIRLNLTSATAAVRYRDWADTRAIVEEVSSHLEKVLEKLRQANLLEAEEQSKEVEKSS